MIQGIAFSCRAVQKGFLSEPKQASHHSLNTGVYLMRDSAGKIIYIGKAKDLRKRVLSYFKSNSEDKTAAIVSSLRHIDYILASSEREALILERQLISKFKPYFNVLWLDDKSYPI